MTVAPSSWERSEQVSSKNRKSKTVSASAGTGLQVVAVLFAVRVGYKLARSAGRLIFEATSPSVSSVSEDEQQPALEDFRNEGDDGVSARDQWVLCCDQLQEPPEGSRLMASEHLPISVYHFYEQFLSIETSCLQDHHQSTGQFSFRSSRWKADGAGHFSRTFDFMQPKKGVCSANAHCVQEQRFSVHAGGEFVMTTDMTMTGIPYADSFRVQSFWKAAPDATGLGCNVSVHVAVPFNKRCMVKGLITNTTYKDCQSFFSDFLAKVQNSIATELLPAAAAQAAAAEQLLGSSPAAAAAAALSSHLPQPPPLLLGGASGRGHAAGAAGVGTGGAAVSPFAVDAEVFVSTPIQAGGSAPQRKRGGNGKAAHSWFNWPHKNHKQQQGSQQQQQQHQAQPAGLDAAAAASTAAADGDVLQQLPEQQRYSHLQQWSHAASRVHGYGHGHEHMLPPSHCMSPSRAVSVKPSFALPIDDLRLPNRVRPAEFITTAQAILLLLVLVVQLITLYDNMAIRRLLAASEPLGALAHKL